MHHRAGHSQPTEQNSPPFLERLFNHISANDCQNTKESLSSGARKRRFMGAGPFLSLFPFVFFGAFKNETPTKLPGVRQA
jgi:hypothetical protein